MKKKLLLIFFIPLFNFGHSVYLSPNGARGNYGINGKDSGHVCVYDLNAVLSSDTFSFSQFSMAPNPIKNQATIKLNINKGLILEKISIYNSVGQYI